MPPRGPPRESQIPDTDKDFENSILDNFKQKIRNFLKHKKVNIPGAAKRRSGRGLNSRYRYEFLLLQGIVCTDHEGRAAAAVAAAAPDSV